MRSHCLHQGIGVGEVRSGVGAMVGVSGGMMMTVTMGTAVGVGVGGSKVGNSVAVAEGG